MPCKDLATSFIIKRPQQRLAVHRIGLGARRWRQGTAIDGTLLWLVSSAVVAVIIVAAFFGTGFLLLTHSREEMLATRSESAAATLTPPAQTDPPAAATPNYPASPTTVALPPSPRLVAEFAEAAVKKGITLEQYRNARLQFLRRQQALFELLLTEPNYLFAAETRILERQKAYWDRAIAQTMALP